jgi:hypothetical protein
MRSPLQLLPCPRGRAPTLCARVLLHNLSWHHRPRPEQIHDHRGHHMSASRDGAVRLTTQGRDADHALTDHPLHPPDMPGLLAAVLPTLHVLVMCFAPVGPPASMTASIVDQIRSLTLDPIHRHTSGMTTTPPCWGRTSAYLISASHAPASLKCVSRAPSLSGRRRNCARAAVTQKRSVSEALSTDHCHALIEAPKFTFYFEILPPARTLAAPSRSVAKNMPMCGRYWQHSLTVRAAH